jgi:F-type H+-transporting ATPase subunit epsilon
MAPMAFEIVTAERIVYSDEVDLVVVPGVEGELGILPNHVPLLTTIQPGELRVVKQGQDTTIAVTGGFLEVLANKVLILADSAEHADEISSERAQDAIRRAEERLLRRENDLDLERAVKAVRKAQVRLRVARRRGTPSG